MTRYFFISCTKMSIFVETDYNNIMTGGQIKPEKIGQPLSVLLDHFREIGNLEIYRCC